LYNKFVRRSAFKCENGETLVYFTGVPGRSDASLAGSSIRAAVSLPARHQEKIVTTANPRVPLSTFTYDPDYFEMLFAIEDRHFWFRARNRLLAALVQQMVGRLPQDYRALEVGCGTGNVLRMLETVCGRSHVLGMDLFRKGLQYASQRVTCGLVQGDMHHPPFATGFDLIGLFDVLEHLPEDVRVLQDLRSMLAVGGVLLLTVPADPGLWSYFDEASHHVRRYQAGELRQRLLDAGFEVEYLTPYMVSIFPMVWSGRRLNALLRPAEIHEVKVHHLAASELRITPGINEILEWLLSLERSAILHRRVQPFGTSLLAIARRVD